MGPIISFPLDLRPTRFTSSLLPSSLYPGKRTRTGSCCERLPLLRAHTAGDTHFSSFQHVGVGAGRRRYYSVSFIPEFAQTTRIEKDVSVLQTFSRRLHQSDEPAPLRR